MGSSAEKAASSVEKRGTAALSDLEGADQAPASAMRVFSAFEPSYWRGMLCTLGSLMRRAESPLGIDLLAKAEHELELRRHLSLLERRFPLWSDINVVAMPAAFVKECERLYMTDHFTPEACYRLYYFDIIDISGRDALYVDLDLIVRLPIGSIASVLSDEQAIWARRIEKPAHVASSLKSVTDYFNSGLVLFRTSRHAAEISARLGQARELLPKIAFESRYLDQDVLNLAFSARWGALPRRFNYTTADLGDEYLLDEAVLHATGSRKPWFFGGRHRFMPEYTEEMQALGMPFLSRYKMDWPVSVAKRKFRR